MRDGRWVETGGGGNEVGRIVGIERVGREREGLRRQAGWIIAEYGNGIGQFEGGDEN